MFKRFKEAEEEKASRGTKEERNESVVKNNTRVRLSKKNHNCEVELNEREK